MFFQAVAVEHLARQYGLLSFHAFMAHQRDICDVMAQPRLPPIIACASLSSTVGKHSLHAEPSPVSVIIGCQDPHNMGRYCLIEQM